MSDGNNNPPLDGGEPAPAAEPNPTLPDDSVSEAAPSAEAEPNPGLTETSSGAAEEQDAHGNPPLPTP